MCYFQLRKESGTTFVPLLTARGSKNFMEAGKERLARDTLCDATRAEVDGVKKENEREIDSQIPWIYYW